ncbi:MAG: DnaA regulatory inactivator Hda [Lysobacteraceae bacterium]|nr:MAG: DnaA regulatory inactivator Hda [Xanthomonadaceae bacterium]
MPKLPEQLTLAIDAAHKPDFDSFVAVEGNPVVAVLRQFVNRNDAAWPLLEGTAGTGRSHLLLATARAAFEQGRPVQYLATADHIDSAVAFFDHLRGGEYALVDDLDLLFGSDQAERACFNAFNRLRQGGGALLAAVAPGWSNRVKLPDLRSRLNWGQRLILTPLPDQQIEQLLQQRARDLGIELSATVVRYMMTRHQRNLSQLIDLLQKSADRSLKLRRKVTVALVREVMSDLVAQQATA